MRYLLPGLGGCPAQVFIFAADRPNRNNHSSKKGVEMTDWLENLANKLSPQGAPQKNAIPISELSCRHDCLPVSLKRIGKINNAVLVFSFIAVLLGVILKQIR